MADKRTIIVVVEVSIDRSEQTLSVKEQIKKASVGASVQTKAPVKPSDLIKRPATTRLENIVQEWKTAVLVSGTYKG